MTRLILILCALFLAAPSAAQPMAAGAPHIRPTLVVEAPAGDDGVVELAILMTPERGWHGYWLNPGDAGLPPQVEWALPAGARVEPLRYPVPERLLVAGIVNHVYERDYALLTRLHLPKGQTGDVPVSAKMRWLACTDKICVPESGTVSIDVPVGGERAVDSRFDEWRRALPRPLAAPARFDVAGDQLRLEIPLPSGVTLGEPYFFPLEDGPVDYAAAQQFRRDGDRLLVELKRRDAAPDRLTGVLALGDGRGLELEAVPGTVAWGGQAIGEAGWGALWAALLGALVGGLILNLMPCVFPILALKALHLARSGGDERQARGEALAYAAGAVAGTGLLGVALLALRAGGSAVGWAFQLQDPRTTIILLLLATAITVNLLKWFELPVLAGERSAGGSFGTGALAAFVATPCAGPFLGAALGTALLLPAAGSVLVFAALGLGLALPFLLVAFVPKLRTRLPKPGAWMARLQRFLAIPMAASAAGCLWLLWRQGGAAALGVGLVAVVALLLLLGWTGWRQRRGEPNGWAALVVVAVLAGSAALLVPASQKARPTLPMGQLAFSEAALAKARASGKPVFVYFTADWCLTCKVNEQGAIEREAVREAFRAKGVTTMVGDWTNGDPAITRFLDGRGRAGVPLYLWYAPGSTEAEELPQVLTPAMLISRASAAR